MDNLIFFVLGFCLAILLIGRPIKIVVHHKNENIIPDIPDTIMPKMAELDKKIDPEEDKTYEEMGKIIDNVQDIFGGSDRV